MYFDYFVLINQNLKQLTLIYLFFLHLKTCGAERVTQEVYFDIDIGDRPVGTVQIGLFGDIAPRTVNNFVRLATDGATFEGHYGRYQGSIIHRVIRNFMIQGMPVIRMGFMVQGTCQSSRTSGSKEGKDQNVLYDQYSTCIPTDFNATIKIQWRMIVNSAWSLPYWSITRKNLEVIGGYGVLIMG